MWWWWTPGVAAVPAGRVMAELLETEESERAMGRGYGLERRGVLCVRVGCISRGSVWGWLVFVWRR